MGTYYAPLIADVFFYYVRDFMISLSDDKQTNIIDAFNTTSRYLNDILDINNDYFDKLVSQILPSKLQFNKANTSDTKDAYFNLHFSISYDIVSPKIYEQRDETDFETVNIPFLDCDVPHLTSYKVLSHNSFFLLKHLAMLLTSAFAIYCLLRNFLSKAIGIINFTKPFLKFIEYTMI